MSTVTLDVIARDYASGVLRSVEGSATSGSAALRGMGGVLKYTGIAAGIGLGVAVKKAADFNAEMALVKTLAKANATQMRQLSAAAMTTGTQYGYTADQVADAQAELIKAGVSVKDILGGSLTGALTLAAAGQTDVAEATEVAASAMTQFRLKGKDVPHIADLLAAGADKALGSVGDLGYGLKQVGLTAHQSGLSIEDTVGVLAEFAQAGLIGERGGTVFNGMLLRLQNPSERASGYMEDLGISIYNANGQIKTMPELADNLQRSLGNLAPAQRNMALGAIFGQRSIRGANILLAEGAKGTQEWIDKVNDQGFAAQQASGKLNSLKGDLQKFKSEGVSALIDLGSGSQAPLRKLVTGATRELHKLTANHDLRDWGNEIGDDIQKTIAAAAPLAKTVGHDLAVVGSGVKTVVSEFNKLPSGVQKTIVAGGLTAVAIHKTGLDSLLTKGLGKTAGSALGGRGVVPVFVTNKGFGGEDGALSKVTKAAPIGAGIASGAGGLASGGAIALLSSLGLTAYGYHQDSQKSKSWQNSGQYMGSGYGGVGRYNSNMPDTKGLKDAVAQAMKVKAALSSLPKGVQTRISTPGAVTSLKDVGSLARQYDLTPKQVQTLMKVAGVAQAKGFLGQITSAMDGIPLSRTAKVNANTGAARAGIAAVLAGINALHDKTVTLTTIRKVYGAQAQNQHAQHGPLADRNSRMMAGLDPTNGRSLGPLSDLPDDAARHIRRKAVQLDDAGADLVKHLVHGINKHKVKAKDALDKVKGYVDDLKSKLDQAKQTEADFAGGFNVGTSIFADQPEDGTTLSLSSLMGSQMKKLAAAQSYQADMNKLIGPGGLGLSKDYVQQLQASGASGVQAMHLLATQADAQSIATLNSLNASTNAAYGAAGAQAGSAVYGQATKDAQTAYNIGKAVEDAFSKLDLKGSVKINGADILVAIKASQKAKGKKKVDD